MQYAFSPQTAFTTKKDYDKEESEAQWATTQRTVHDLPPPNTSNFLNEGSSSRKLTEIPEEAMKHAEIER